MPNFAYIKGELSNEIMSSSSDTSPLDVNLVPSDEEEDFGPSTPEEWYNHNKLWHSSEKVADIKELYKQRCDCCF